MLCRFVENVTALRGDERIQEIFFDITWKELLALVDPQEVLLRVVEELKSKGELADFVAEGFTTDSLRASLEEWKGALTGSDLGSRSSNPLQDDSDLTLDDLDDQSDDGGQSNANRRGSFTRSDFPLLASIARVFLALPGRNRDERLYRNVGFTLPGDVARYDHIILDEAQDFTYAEVHLAMSLVEDKRLAISISGDPFQRMDWKYGFSGFESVQVASDRRFEIVRNYRQTKQLGDWLQRLSDQLFGKTQTLLSQAMKLGRLQTSKSVKEQRHVLLKRTVGSANGIRGIAVRSRRCC